MAAEAAAPQLYIMASIILGLVVGLIEMLFVHSDETGMGWLKHALHAFPVTVIFVFIASNVSWVLGLLPWDFATGFFVDLGVKVLVGIIAMIKISGAAAIAGRVGEKKWHILIIGILVIVSGYLTQYLHDFVIAQYFPGFLQF